VRTGDLKEFAEVIEKYKDAFSADKNYTLVQRLRHNVCMNVYIALFYTVFIFIIAITFTGIIDMYVWVVLGAQVCMCTYVFMH
jgi:hypothetical protein